MLFNLEEDAGAWVRGYVVPDGYSTVPTIRVHGGGRRILSFAANEIRDSLVVAARHETGRCGFLIDEAAIPNLRELADLEIYDAESSILVYRRPKPDNLKKKILRLETHLFPLWALDVALAPHFQYFAKGIEDFGRETVTQLFLLNLIESVWLSGKILYRNFAYFIEWGFETIVMLQNPFDELAERLLVLSKVRKVGSKHLGLREGAALGPAIDFAESLTFQDEKAMRRALRQMPDEVALLLANPVVRQFTATTPDEMPTGGAVGAALDVLASSIVVGRRENPDGFLETLGEYLGPAAAALPKPPKFPPVAALARLMREIGEIEAILEKDLELYHYVEKAAQKAP